jgi:hypothetical protein
MYCVRYYNQDWSIPIVENEFLFAGSKDQCLEYIRREHSADMLDPAYEIQKDFLYRIQLGKIKCPAIFTPETLQKMWNEGKEWDSQCDWEPINHKNFCYNECVIEVY